MEIKGRAIEGFLSALDPAVIAVLLHGEDMGLIRERADRLARQIVPDLGDPFRIVELNAGDILEDPARLADETQAIAMLGGRRVIRIRRAGDPLAKHMERFFEAPLGDALILVEAGILMRRSSLRQVFESAKCAAAMACYADGPAEIENLVMQFARARNLSLEPGTMEALQRHLGGDRLASRAELEKLDLYLGPHAKTLTLADVMASIAETNETEMDEIVDAAAEGDTVRLDRLIAKAYAAGLSPIALLRAAELHLQRLHLLSAQAQRGGSIESLVRGLKPGLPYPRVERVVRQLRSWSPQRLAEMIPLLNEAEISCKTTGMPDDAIAARTLMGIALRARSR